nr:Xaa-Pro peptidase family protein [uncultured Albidiferax sp.]
MALIRPTQRLEDCEPTAAEIAQIQRDRMARVKAELKKRDLTACILFDPTHIRYASGSRNMQVYSMRNPARYLFVPAEGKVVMFEYAGCDFLADGLDTIDEVRPATAISYYFCDDMLGEVTKRWAAELHALIQQCGGGKKIALESATSAAAFALQAYGYILSDAQEPLERARCIKVDNEIKMVRASLRAAEQGVRNLEAALVPGITENALWSHLHQHIIATDGDYIETRLLSSGPRTNPWFHECSTRVIEDGDLVGLDTDVVGRFGYYADFSRTFLCGKGPANAAQKTVYQLAYEQIHTNMELVKPGMSFSEYTTRAWKIPKPYQARRYFALAHGVGMCGEYPYIVHREDSDAKGYDGVFEPGMTLCIESYIGHEDGGEGAKLEEQIYIRNDGSIELLSDYPFEQRLLG